MHAGLMPEQCGLDEDVVDSIRHLQRRLSQAKFAGDPEEDRYTVEQYNPKLFILKSQVKRRRNIFSGSSHLTHHWDVLPCWWAPSAGEVP